MNRRDIRRDIKINLEESGQGFYSDEEINDSIQDCYNEVCAKTQCFTSKVTVDFLATNYYDFPDLGILDYLGAIAVFNNNTNLFLADNVSLINFDSIRLDWENWQAQPLFWTPHSLTKIAIIPHMSVPSGNFDLYYYQTAPIIENDDTEILLAEDVQNVFEHYCTADLLETAGEITKAIQFAKQYENTISEYKIRCHEMARAELIRRV